MKFIYIYFNNSQALSRFIVLLSIIYLQGRWWMFTWSYRYLFIVTRAYLWNLFFSESSYIFHSLTVQTITHLRVLTSIKRIYDNNYITQNSYNSCNTNSICFCLWKSKNDSANNNNSCLFRNISHNLTLITYNTHITPNTCYE